MKKLFQTILLLLLASAAAAQESSPQRPPKVLQVFDWKNSAAQFPNSQIVSMDGISVLKIENTNSSRLEFSLMTITNPSLVKAGSIISCEIKYENVVGDYDKTPKGAGVVSYGPWKVGRLKLLEIFPPVATGGDETTNQFENLFEGTSNWKLSQFKIFQPIVPKLDLKIFLPSYGMVYLRPIKLLVAARNWWTPEQAGIAGGIGGAIIGCLGGLIGLLAGKGKARNFVLATMKFFFVLGIFLLVAGIVAIAYKQPYAVWYSLLLPGFIMTLVFSLNLPSIQRRYDELEIRRMTSIDTMRS